jgi:hypothetical protein
MAKQQQQERKRSDQRAPQRGTRDSDVAPRGDGAQVERDEIYGLISVMYHALQGSETYQQYVEDADEADDTELREFFEQCQAEEAQRASRARELLVQRLGETGDNGPSTFRTRADEDE